MVLGVKSEVPINYYSQKRNFLIIEPWLGKQPTSMDKVSFIWTYDDDGDKLLLALSLNVQ